MEVQQIKVCQTKLVNKALSRSDKSCLYLLESCVLIIQDKIKENTLEANDTEAEQCAPLLSLAKNNLDINTRQQEVKEVKADLDALRKSEKERVIELELEKSNLASKTEQKKETQDAITNKEATISKYLADEAQAQNLVNQAKVDLHLVRTQHNNQNPCFGEPSPHVQAQCVDRYATKLRERENERNNYIQKKEQAERELGTLRETQSNLQNEIQALENSVLEKSQESRVEFLSEQEKTYHEAYNEYSSFENLHSAITEESFVNAVGEIINNNEQEEML